ncbi:hypothetical protein NP493_1917g00021 [Ridgeia piscesae]|uniref:Uncharacterized protein n=1 Tax=Ridgeia piscesae TaxID=27915 RepID=A0AAD9JQ01_RIDPI|nr:hypothetical protein NP493_1917g00021 [Ridgeia piscesae]
MEVVETLKGVLTQKLGEGTFEIIDVTFSKGSIDVNYELAVNKAEATKTLETIIDTVKEATKSGSFGNFIIDPASVKVEIGPPWLAIVLGSVLGVVFLAMTVVLIFHIVRTVRKNRVLDKSPDGSEAGLPNYRMRHPDRRFWQARGDTMQEPRETPLQDAYDHQRMNDWGVVRNFAGPQRQAKFHRRPDANEWVSISSDY